MIIVIAHRAVFRASSAGFLLYSELSGSVQRILGSSHARKRKLPVAPEGATGKCECTQVFLRSARKISRKNPEQRQFSSVDAAASKLTAPSAAKCPTSNRFAHQHMRTKPGLPKRRHGFETCLL